MYLQFLYVIGASSSRSITGFVLLVHRIIPYLQATQDFPTIQPHRQRPCIIRVLCRFPTLRLRQGEPIESLLTHSRQAESIESPVSDLYEVSQSNPPYPLFISDKVSWCNPYSLTQTRRVNKITRLWLWQGEHKESWLWHVEPLESRLHLKKWSQ